MEVGPDARHLYLISIIKFEGLSLLKISNFMNVTKQLINCSLHKFVLNFKSKLCMNDFRKSTQYKMNCYVHKEAIIVKDEGVMR